MISTSEVKEVNVFIINQLLECVRRVLFPAVRCAVNFSSCDRDRELKAVVSWVFLLQIGAFWLHCVDKKSLGVSVSFNACNGRVVVY